MRSVSAPVSGRELIGLSIAALVLFAAARAVAGYGLDVSDEGTIVFAAAQMASGLVPYRDFNSFYTPLSWFLHSVVFKTAGVDLVALRTFFGGVAALLAVGIYVLARHFVPRPFAAVAGLTFALIFPIPQVWAPYPAWYGLGSLLVSLLAMLRWLRVRRWGWLLVAGVGCGLAFGNKPNVGLFMLLGFGGFLVLRARSLHPPPAGLQAGWTNRVPSWATPLMQGLFLLAVAVAFWLLLRGAATPGNQALFLFTLLLAGAAAVEPFRESGSADAFVVAVGRGLVVFAGFLLVTLPWYVGLSVLAGWDRTFETIFGQGPRLAWAFYEPIWLPSRDALEAAAWVAGAALVVLVLGRSARRGGFVGTPLILGLAAVGGAILTIAAGRALTLGLDPTAYLWANVATRFERTAREETDLMVYVPFAATWATAGLLLWRQRVRRRQLDRHHHSLQMMVWVLALFLFQYYPRASYLHGLFLAGPYLVLGSVLASELWKWSAPAMPSHAWRAGLGALLVVFPLILVPTAIRSRVDAIRQADQRVEMPHARLRAGGVTAARLRFLESKLTGLPPRAPLFTYPAVTMANLLTDRPNPTRENHITAGLVDEAGQREIIAALESSRTPAVLWDQELIDRFGYAERDRLLIDYLWTAYQPVGVKESWVVLLRKP